MLPRLPFRTAAQQIFFRHHLEDRADVLRHPAMDEHQGILKLPPRLGGDFLLPQNPVTRHEAAPADAEFGISFASGHAFD